MGRQIIWASDGGRSKGGSQNTAKKMTAEAKKKKKKAAKIATKKEFGTRARLPRWAILSASGSVTQGLKDISKLCYTAGVHLVLCRYFQARSEGPNTWTYQITTLPIAEPDTCARQSSKITWAVLGKLADLYLKTTFLSTICVARHNG